MTDLSQITVEEYHSLLMRSKSPKEISELARQVKIAKGELFINNSGFYLGAYMVSLQKGYFSRDETIKYEGSDPIAAIVDATPDPNNQYFDPMIDLMRFTG
ncbi:MAG: hypothetical protein PHF86_03505 [Candidatus Nanoarchaeia archaeon]|nr:hypothetical protein [Candidatus Nanoarchaeia archaeon]